MIFVKPATRRAVVAVLVTLSLSRIADANNDAGRVWIDETTRNGSFEETVKHAGHPWIAQSPGSLQHSLEVRRGTPELPAAQGNAYLVLNATSKDQNHNNISVFLRKLAPIDPGAGNLFKLSWKTRNRGPEDFDFTAARIVIPPSEPGQKAILKQGEWHPVSAEGWGSHEFSCVLNDSELNNGISLSILFQSRSSKRSIRECVAHLDSVRLEQLLVPPGENPEPDSNPVPHQAGQVENKGTIPVRFQLDKPGFVTLVIEDEKGKRVRNLLGAEWFEAGAQTVFWDGMDEGSPAPVPGSGGQTIKREFVDAGSYRVRGLVRDALKLTYEFTAYPNVGNPPWVTDLQSGKGGWLADHGVPTAAAFIPAARAPGGVDQVVLAAPVSEAAQALAWVDLDGNKLAGRWRLGGHWTGAGFLASDPGPDPHPQIYLYTLQPWKRSKEPTAFEMRVMGLAKEGAYTVGMIPHDISPDDVETFHSTGLAVYNQRLVYATNRPGKIYFYDVSAVSSSKQAVFLGEAEIADPRGLAFDAKGRLLVISGSKVLRYSIGSFPSPLSEPEEVIKSGLEDPNAITLDGEGNLYVADWGSSHQVKVFDASGRPLRVIGRPGKPSTGPFDQERMNFPYGMAVDSRGQLWVPGYRWRTPKAVNLWTTGGKFLRGFYGPSEYGGGGTFDPADPSRMLYSNMQGGMEFKLDWKTGTAVPASIYWLSSEAPLPNPRWKGPDFPRRIGKHRYITNEFGGPTSGSKLLTIWKDHSPSGIQPMVFIGGAGGWSEMEKLGLMEQFAEIKARGKAVWHRFVQSLLVCWTDVNGDGQVQPGEVATRSLMEDPSMGYIASAAFGKDYELLITHAKGVLSLKARSVREDGLPLYDLEDCQPVATNLKVPLASGGGQALEAEDGSLIVTGGPIYGVKNGEVLWTYASQWPGLHAGHAAPKSPEHSGQILATTRLLGPLVRPGKGEAGQLWSINSDKGLAYLFTADGLFVGNLFQLASQGERWNVPEAKRGMDLTNFSYEGETFWPTLAAFEDGRLVMQAGKAHSSIVEIHGLESVRRISGLSLTLGEAEIAAAREHQQRLAVQRHSEAGTDRAVIARIERPLEVDGNLADWPALHWLPITRGMVMSGFSGKAAVWTAAAMGVDNDTLYIALRTRQKEDLLANSGTDLQTLFRAGGGFDLALATKKAEGSGKEPVEGDVRLVVALVNGLPKAALYQPVVPGTEKPVIYESPVGMTRIDVIKDVSESIRIASGRVTLTAKEAGAMKKGDFQQIEMAIPLSVLGWNPRDLPVTRGDIGVLMGRSGVTSDRSYWYNQNAGIVNDIPSEARITPERWGSWEVAPK